MSKHGRILVAMSGGIDSSMAALMLHEQGYEVIGITMKTWDYALAGKGHKETGCCSLDAIHDARKLAVDLGFPHYVLDIRELFKTHIIDYFKQEYLHGRTPNPCVMCNTYVKWDVLLSKADAFDCPQVATGHYARVRSENNRQVLYEALDKSKDQTYALWGVNQDALARTVFPMGTQYKKNVKAMAQQAGLEALANKPESYEICFIPDNDYRQFIRNQPTSEGHNQATKSGDFILEGKVVGKHQGYAYYTIGQRKGLDIALGYPVYVIRIDTQRNEIILGTAKQLQANTMHIANANWIKYEQIPDNLSVRAKIRYNDPGAPATLIAGKQVLFDQPASAIAPGQAAVFYEKEDLVGGAWIQAQPNPVKEEMICDA